MLMTSNKPILQNYGPLHALSSRGLHVRQSARSWKLVVPMSAELVETVRLFCERTSLADALSLLLLLDELMQRRGVLPQESLQRALSGAWSHAPPEEHGVSAAS
jgi:hypothetical protein